MEEEMRKTSSQAANDPVPDPNRVANDRAKRIREAGRRLGGITALAAKSGVPLSTLNGFLKGADPKSTALVAMARASGVSVEWLATGVGAPDAGKGTPGPAQLTTLFATLDMDRFAKAIEISDEAFRKRHTKPDFKRRAQVFAIVYDFLETQSAEAVRTLVEIGSIDENR